MSWYEPHPFPRFRDYAPSIAIPSVYWDVESAEQRTRAICEILGRVVSYADEMGIEVTRISELLAEIEAGHLDPMIEAAIYDWFVENEPFIVQDINNLKNVLPITEFDDDNNTVHKRFLRDEQSIANANADITALTGALSTTNTNVSNLSTRVANINNALTALTTRVNALESIHNTQRYIACCGDSFGNDTDNEWPGMVATRFGYACLNKCTNGAAFTKTNNSIQMQLEAIRDSSQATNSLIDYIIIYAGVNDWNDQHATYDQVSAAVGNCQTIINQIQAAAAENRKPKVIFAFGNCGYARRDQYIGYDRWVKQCVAKVKAQNRMQGVVSGVQYWLVPEPISVWNDDYLHPNAAGERVIASYIGQCIMGTYNGVHKVLASDNVVHASTGHCEVRFDDGLVTVNATMKNASIPLNTQWTSIFDMSTYCWGFGSGNVLTDNETTFIYSPMHQIFVEENDVGMTRFAFNAKLGILWFEKLGSTTAIQNRGGYGANWTGSPHIEINTGCPM